MEIRFLCTGSAPARENPIFACGFLCCSHIQIKNSKNKKKTQKIKALGIPATDQDITETAALLQADSSSSSSAAVLGGDGDGAALETHAASSRPPLAARNRPLPKSRQADARPLPAEVAPSRHLPTSGHRLVGDGVKPATCRALHAAHSEGRRGRKGGDKERTKE